MRYLLILPIILFALNVSASKIQHVRAIWQEDPAHETLLVWTTDKREKDVWVYFDTQSRAGQVAQYASKQRADVSLIKGTFDFRHLVHLQKLNPDTTYFFVIKIGNEIGREWHFKTAPSDKKIPFKLIFGGDSRSDRQKRREINSMIAKMRSADPSIIGLVHGGDFVANGTSWKLWKEWFEDHELTTTPEGRLLPIVPTRGNHEYLSPLFNQLWIRPGKEIYSNYFRSTFGPLSLLTLNTNICHSGKQQDWLAENLSLATDKSQWIIANYHRPAWPGVKRPGRALKHWVPLFEDHQVDLVFESDGHVLKKTVPIYRNRRDDAKGIIYVGEGGMGVPMRTPSKTTEWYLQAPGYAHSHYHVMSLAVTEEKLRLQIHLLDGSIFDTQEFFPRHRNKKAPVFTGAEMINVSN